MAPQSYNLGGKIRASDFNNLANDINEIVGLGAGDAGYGQDSLVVPHVNAGSKIRAADWNNLFTAIRFAAQHQGTTNSIPTQVSDLGYPQKSAIIKFLPTLETDLTNVRGNKLNFDANVMSLDVNKISSQKEYIDPVLTTSNGQGHWNQEVYYEFRATFDSEDARRNFFNSGGEIRVEATLTPTGTDPQSLSWETLLNNIGQIKIGHNTTTSTNQVGSGQAGFTSLSGTYTELYSKGGITGYYSGNQVKVFAKTNGVTAIDIKVQMIDAYPTNADGTVNNFTGDDYVAGDLLIQVNQQRADDPDNSGLGVVNPSPTYSHISEL